MYKFVDIFTSQVYLFIYYFNINLIFLIGPWIKMTDGNIWKGSLNIRKHFGIF